MRHVPPATELLTPAQLERVRARSDWRGAWLVAHAWAVIVLAAVLVVRDGLIQGIVRGLSGYEFGRRVIAQLVRREVARDGERVSRSDEVPIADEIILPLIAARDVLIDSVYDREKHPFTTPPAKLGEDDAMLSLFEDAFSSSLLEEQPIFDPAAVRRLLASMTDAEPAERIAIDGLMNRVLSMALMHQRFGMSG